MDELRGQRPADHVAARVSPRGTPRGSLRAWLASHIRSGGRRSSGRRGARSPRPSFRERLRAGFSQWRLSRSSNPRSPPGHALSPGGLGRPPLRAAGGPMTAAPRPPSSVLSLVGVHRLCSPVFQVNPALHYTTLEVPGARSFGGSGGYGEVELIREHKLAVKTIRDREWYTAELVATLLVGDCALRAGAALNVRGLIVLLGFSLQQRQIVFPAYDMDLGRYIGHLAGPRADNPLVIPAIGARFTEMARAVSFLNTTCGISHLDIKCANILVTLDADAASLRRAVLADFSLVTLNSNSVISRGQFCLPQPPPKGPGALDMPAVLTTANFHTLVGHGYNQPPELLIKYLNNERAEFAGRPLGHDCGLAVDLYALGQVLLEVVVSAYVTPSLGIPVSRFPGFQYFDNRLSPDFAMAILAYRCVLHPALFVDSAETNAHGPPCDAPAWIRRRLRSPALQRIFAGQYKNYQRTHEALLSSVTVGRELRPLLVLVSRLCHANPSARHAQFQV
ncbi:tegument serine/threonine protein kinase [Macacine alphaherpesvirus 1]|uniref:Tegument serine/threonine protein kinase n=1 Tax=Cercopithecine herpesvirus 1 TaxID=10325 RepID=A0A059WJ31_CHV1|nr:tegument serine/threonine protein kinase [Macacine alphaherpesvirus 1]